MCWTRSSSAPACAPRRPTSEATSRSTDDEHFPALRGPLRAPAREIVILQQPVSAGGKAFWPVPSGTPGLPLRVVAGARPVDEHDWLVADDPGVMAGGQGRNLARADLELRAVRHHDVDAAGGVVLEVGRLAPLRAGDGLDVLRPAPARLKRELAHDAAADVDDLGLPLLKRPCLVWVPEVLALCARHSEPP